MGHFVAGEEMGHFVAGTICRVGRKWDILSFGTICHPKNAGGTVCHWDKMSPNLINFVLNFLEKHLSFAYVTEFFLGMQNIDPQKKTCLKNVNVDFMLPATKWCD